MSTAPKPAPIPFHTIVEMERELIVLAMRQTLGNKDGAAWLLGISRSTLYRKLASYEVLPAEWAQSR